MLSLLRPVFRVFRRNVSALYVPGNKAKENIAVLVPHMEFNKRLVDRKQLQQNIARRKITNVDLEDIFEQWDFYEALQMKKAALEKRREEVGKLMMKTKKMDESQEKENLERKYSTEGKVLREDLKTIRDHGYSVEEKFINDFLDIPNDLHADTPDNEAKEFFKFKEIPEHSGTCDHHLEYEELIDYYGESAFYLKKAAAKFDLKFPFYCVDRFKSNGFMQFSNPDFAKTILVEGAAVPLNELFLVGHADDVKCTNRIHLVGNGSMLSFLGFITKLSVPLPMLPHKWICTGKQYQPVGSNELGLYGTCQSTTVQLFAAGLDHQVNEIFHSTLNQIIDLYKDFDLHFRVVYVPAHELRLAECLRMRIEMYSPHLKRYIEVGSLSSYDDFISKRLLFNYSKDNKTHFPHILTATVCDVTKLIGIILENNNGALNMPKLLENI